VKNQHTDLYQQDPPEPTKQKPKYHIDLDMEQEALKHR
jgi:hypothetical protein